MVLLAYKILKFIFRHGVPASLRYPMARGIAHGICLMNARRRNVLIANLTPLVGAGKARQMAPLLLGNFCMTAVDFFCANPLRPRELTFDNWSRIESAYQEKRRVMIVTAHMGNWETGISYLVEKGYPVAGLYATYTDDDIVQWIATHLNPYVMWIPTSP